MKKKIILKRRRGFGVIEELRRTCYLEKKDVEGNKELLNINVSIKNLYCKKRKKVEEMENERGRLLKIMWNR